MKNWIVVLSALAAMAALAQPRPFTMDDEMKMRSIVDVRIAPDGNSVAYVVSTPNLTTNEHDAALYVVPASGGAPKRLGASVRIITRPVPRPHLRWSPDGTMLSLLGIDHDAPQVIALPVDGSAPRALTDTAEGVAGLFEWSPDGNSIA